MSPQYNKNIVLPIRTKLDNDKYEIIDILGKGGFGIVYKVKRLSDFKIFAIKELFIIGEIGKEICFRNIYKTQKVTSNNKSVFNTFKNKVKKEVSFLLKNQNDNIVHTYSYFEENNTIYTVMEYLVGDDLEQIIKKEIFSEDEIIDLLKQLSNAFRVIHNKGRIHRDIKPNNIIRTVDGVYKLIDFTNIKIFLEDDTTTTITELVAKTRFSPPELLTNTNDIKRGAYSDIYSLGMTIYACLSRDFEIPTSVERLIKRSQNEKSRFNEKIDNLYIDDKFKDLIKKMTEIEGKDRIQSIDEVLEYIEKCYPWYKSECITLWTKNYIENIKIPTISLPSFDFSLPKDILINLLKVVGVIVVLFTLYQFFDGNDESISDENQTVDYPTEKVERYENIYYSIFKKNALQLNELNLEDFRKLVKNVDINGIRSREKGSEGETMLNHLSCKGKYYFVKVLVENGIDVNIQDDKGDTALYEAIVYAIKYKDYNKKIINFLIDNGADIKIRRKDSKSILVGAINSNKLCKNKLQDIIQRLVNMGACKNENILYYGGKTILELPNSKLYPDTYQILKKGGC